MKESAPKTDPQTESVLFTIEISVTREEMLHLVNALTHAQSAYKKIWRRRSLKVHELHENAVLGKVKRSVEGHLKSKFLRRG